MGPCRARAAALCGAAALAAGCASEAPPLAEPTRRFDAATDPAVVALPAAEQLALAAQSPYLPDAAQFEATRRDALVGYQPAIPLLATDQWLQTLPPPERPVRFHRWEQH